MLLRFIQETNLLVRFHYGSVLLSLLSGRLHRSRSRNRIMHLDTLSASAPPSTVDDSDEHSNDEIPRLDRVLSQLTSAFPLFVLSSAVLALVKPLSLKWVNQGNLISIMLMLVMCGTVLTLERQDFSNVWGQDWASVPLGVLLQFLIMPLSAWAIGRTFLLPTTATTAAAAATAARGDQVRSALFRTLSRWMLPGRYSR
jgi:hypothetical protein